MKDKKVNLTRDEQVTANTKLGIEKYEEIDEEKLQNSPTRELETKSNPTKNLWWLTIVGVFVMVVLLAYLLNFGYSIKKPETDKTDKNDVTEEKKSEETDYCDTHYCLTEQAGDYILQIVNSTAYLYDAKTNEVLKKFADVQSARLYYETYWDEALEKDVAYRFHGIVLEQNATMAFYNLELDEITIPYGKYSKLYTDNVRDFSWQSNVPLTYIIALAWSTGNHKLAVVNITSGKEMMPLGDYVGVDDVNSQVFIVYREKGDKTFAGLVSKTKCKEIVATVYSDIRCGAYACTLVGDDHSEFKVYAVKEKKYLDFNSTFQPSVEVKKMLKTIKTLGYWDLGDKLLENINDLSNDVKKQIAFEFSPLNYDEESVDIVKAAVLTESLQKVFGPEASLIHGNIKCKCGEYMIIYDKKKDSYSWSEDHGPHRRESNIFDYVVNYQEIDDHHEITVKRIYTSWDELWDYDLDFWADVKKKIKLFSPTDIYPNKTTVLADVLYFLNKNFATISEKSPGYKYVFRKEGTSYILTEYEYLPAK